jgi:hypothetical protein
MTDQEIIDVVSAHKEGKIIQYRGRGAITWITTHVCQWYFADYEYRVKPEPITCYANVYPHETTFYSTLKGANEFAGDGRIRCVKLVESSDQSEIKS